MRISMEFNSVEEIIKLIRGLKNNKALWLYGISNYIIKFSTTMLTPFVVQLLNVCVQNGVFSENCKYCAAS